MEVKELAVGKVAVLVLKVAVLAHKVAALVHKHTVLMQDIRGKVTKVILIKVTRVKGHRFKQVEEFPACKAPGPGTVCKVAEA